MYKVNIGQKVLSKNEKYARLNSEFLKKNQQFALNMISSPGSGKTSILTRTITDTKCGLNISVIEGDVHTDFDAQRIRQVDCPVIQIETAGSCHLSAQQINEALNNLPLGKPGIVIIENVGNLVCPASFDLGENVKIVVLSVTEGDDKPVKYPSVFSKAEVMLINKIDLLDVVDFDLQRATGDALKLNKDLKIFPVSAKTGQGMSDFYGWLKSKI